MNHLIRPTSSAGAPGALRALGSIGVLAVPALAVLALAAPARAGDIRTYTDQATFLAETGGSNATGPLPDLGFVPLGATVGSLAFSIGPGGDDLMIGAVGTPAEPDWCPLLDGNDIAQGFENLQVDSGAPIYALGFDFVQPDATMPDWGGTPVDSIFELSLYEGATLVGQTQFRGIPTDIVTFIGVWSSEAFSTVTIVDVTDSLFVDDDEFFGEFYTGSTPLPTVTSYTDKATFLSETGAISASGPIPDLGLVGSAKLGSVDIGIGEGGDDLILGAFGTDAAPDWCPMLPGHDIAQGYENLSVEMDAPVNAFGFEFVQPDATMPDFGGTPVDSTFEVSLYAEDVLVGQAQFSSIPVDVVTFIGVSCATAFDRATVVDITDSPFVDDDEFYGEFFTGPGPHAWNNLGYGLQGVSGDPLLFGVGPLTAGSNGWLVLVNAAPLKPARLFVSLAQAAVPFKCGTLVPVPWMTSLLLFTNGAGDISLAWPSWPAGLSTLGLRFQYALPDPAAPCGVAISNALRADVP